MTNAEKMEEVFGFPKEFFSGLLCDSIVNCPEKCEFCNGYKVKWADEYKGKIEVEKHV